MKVRRVLIVASLSAAVFLLFLAGSLLAFRIERASDFARQRARIEALKAAGRGAVPGVRLPDEDLSDGLPYDRVRMIATHNSYRSRSGALRLFLIDLAQKGEAAKLDYGHPALSGQLESGIRSFELDLRYGGRGFECAHVPLVDDRSGVPDFALALRELALWTERHPRAVPVVLLLELKDDYRFLDPGLKPIGGPELDALDALLRRELGARLFEPDEFRGTFPSPARAAAERGWPSLGGLRGRFLVVLHPDAGYRALYRAGRPVLEGRAMFTAVQTPGEGDEDTVFTVLNDPVGQASDIEAAVGRGWIVRTRADADGILDPSVRAAALAGSAQIVSTDYPKACPARDGWFVEFKGGGTLEAR